MRPRSVGTFLMSRRPTSAKLAARAMIRSTSARSRSSIASRCLIGLLLGGGAATPSAAASIATSSALVDLLEPHEDALVAGGRQVLADVVGPDRELAVAAVGEHRELDPLRAAVVEQGVDRRPRGAAGEQDVVDQDHGAAVELEVEVRGVDDRLGAGLAVGQVVAVEGDVEVAERHLGPGQLADQRVQAAAPAPLRGCGCRPAPAGLRSRVLLDDLVRDPDQGAAQIVAVEHHPVGALVTAPLPGLSGPG